MSLRASDGKLGVRVGAVTLVLLVLGVAYVVLLRGKLFLGPSVDVELYFAHVGSLKEGAPVMVAGRAVGKITAIRLVPRDLAGDDHLLADTGGAVAILRIDARRRGMVPINGEFFVSSRGLLSERYVEVVSELLANAMGKSWPGNVRELRNFVKRALVMRQLEGGGSVPARLVATASEPPLAAQEGATLPLADARARVMSAFEKKYVIDLLEKHGRVVTAAAETAGVDRSYLHRLMRKYGL